MDKHSWDGCEFMIINTPRGVTTQDKVKLLRIMSVPWVGDLGLLQEQSRSDGFWTTGLVFINQHRVSVTAGEKLGYAATGFRPWGILSG